MTLTALTRALAPTYNTYVTATGGTPPYVYSIVSGGGSVNSATGLFTAPNTPATVVVKAVDADLEEATVTINVMGAVKLFADVIKTFMGLADDQVYLYNQKFKIPPDDRIYIAIKYPEAKPFANNTKYDGTGAGLVAQQTTHFNATIMVDIMSKSTAALERKEEVVLALTSDYSKRQQQLNAFSIARMSQRIVALNELEGDAIPYRFNLSVGLQYAFRKLSATEYFDNFQDVEVQTDP